MFFLRSAIAVFYFVGYSGVALSNDNCSVEFLQNGEQIQPEYISGWALIPLKKIAFEISVRPSECQPLLASLTKAASIADVSSISGLVFTLGGHAFATDGSTEDVLVWASVGQIRVSLSDISTDWKTIDVYKEESARLGYSPQPVNAWGTGLAAIPGKKAAGAVFKNITPGVAIDSKMPDVQVPIVIFNNEKELLKPTWHNAVPTAFLKSVYKAVLIFK